MRDGVGRSESEAAGVGWLWGVGSICLMRGRKVEGDEYCWEMATVRQSAIALVGIHHMPLGSVLYPWAVQVRP